LKKLHLGFEKPAEFSTAVAILPGMLRGVLKKGKDGLKTELKSCLKPAGLNSNSRVVSEPDLRNVQQVPSTGEQIVRRSSRQRVTFHPYQHIS
jgi:hypothetical protein